MERPENEGHRDGRRSWFQGSTESEVGSGKYRVVAKLGAAFCPPCGDLDGKGGSGIVQGNQGCYWRHPGGHHRADDTIGQGHAG